MRPYLTDQLQAMERTRRTGAHSGSGSRTAGRGDQAGCVMPPGGRVATWRGSGRLGGASRSSAGWLAAESWRRRSTSAPVCGSRPIRASPSRPIAKMPARVVRCNADT
jgi:hypothetical protein